MATLSILVPAYNEADTIAAILEKILEAPLGYSMGKEVIVVNDGSTDATGAIVEKYIRQFEKGKNETYGQTKIIVHHEKRNAGKGASIHTGIRLASGDYVIVQDADLEYDPREFSILLKPMVEGFADVVYGSRFMGGNPHRMLFFWHSIGNKLLTFLSNMFSNLNLTDIETCYKLFKSDIIKNLKLKEKRFGFEPEVTAKMAKIKGIRIYEVGISYYGRTYLEGKKIGMKDAFRTFWCILRYNLGS